MIGVPRLRARRRVTEPCLGSSLLSCSRALPVKLTRAPADIPSETQTGGGASDTQVHGEESQSRFTAESR